MSTRIWIYKSTDEKIESLAKLFKITKTQIVEIAVNDYYRKIRKATEI